MKCRQSDVQAKESPRSRKRRLATHQKTTEKKTLISLVPANDGGS